MGVPLVETPGVQARYVVPPYGAAVAVPDAGLPYVVAVVVPDVAPACAVVVELDVATPYVVAEPEQGEESAVVAARY